MIKSLSKEMGKTLLFGAVLILWAVLMFHFEPASELREYVIDRQAAWLGNEEMLYGDKTIWQSFRADHDFNTIEIMMGKSDNDCSGCLEASLYAKSGAAVGQWSVEITEDSFQSFDWLELELSSRAVGGGEEYNLLITAPEMDEERCLVISISSSSLGEFGTLWIDGESQENILGFSVFNEYPNIFVKSSIIIFILAVQLWWLMRHIPLSKTALILLLGMGLSMQMALAPFAAPDDRYHYDASLILSNILMGRNDPYSIEEEYYDFEGLRLHYNSNNAFVRTLEDIQHPKDVNTKLGTIDDWDNTDARLMHPIKYLPQALGISLGRVLGLNFGWTFFLGRLFNLLAYVALVSAAIAILPQYQELFLLFALLPMNLQQATSYSRDTMMIACFFLFFALVVKLCRQEKKANMMDALALGLSAGVFVPIKAVYMPLLLLLFAIPGKRFANKKHRVAFLVLTVLLVMLFFVFTNSGLIRSVEDELRRNEAETAVEMLGEETADVLDTADEIVMTEAKTMHTLSDIVRDPSAFIKKILKTVYKNVFDLTLTAGGTRLAGMNLYVAPQFLVGMWFLILLSALCLKKGETPLSAGERVVVLPSCLLVAFAVFVGAFQWTHIEYDFISGVQGRYFLPAALPALLCLKTGRRTSASNSTMLLGIYCILQLGVLHDILSNVVF